MQKASNSNNGCDVLLIGYEAQENLGLRSLAAFLGREGISVEIERMQGTTKENILERIRAENPQIVGFSLIFQRMLADFSDLIFYLRKNGVTAHFTIGGHFPTFEFNEMLSSIPGLDSVVRHEGERTLLELFRSLDQPGSWEKIKSLAYRQDGKIKATPLRPLIVDLDSLPFPVRNPRFITHRGIGVRSIASSRGCYYDCTFCSIHEFYRRPPGPKRRSRSPAHVIQEMEQLFNEFGVRIFIFQDDDLFMRGRQHRQWLEDFLFELKNRKMADQILWRVSCRIDDIDRELIQRMKESGLASVYIGIESGDNQGLRTFNKHYSVKDIYKALDLLREINMPFEFGFMIFEPESTMASVRENINFLKEICRDGLCLVNFCKMSPYAGTPIARRLQEEGRLEGTVACPDYRFHDPKLELLQLFFSQTFNFRNFNENGLVERLRFSKFDTCVIKKFFSEEYDARAYANSVRDLIRWCNESALETMSMAANFMEMYDEEKIMDHWHLLQRLAEEEHKTEIRITNELDHLMSQYGTETLNQIRNRE